MDSITQTVGKTLWQPIEYLFLNSGEEPYWLYWFTCASIAIFVYALRHGIHDGMIALRKDFLPKGREGWRVVRTDLLLFPVTFFTLIILMAPVIGFISEASVMVHDYLLSRFGPISSGFLHIALFRDVAVILFALLAFVVGDLAFTLVHVAFHKIPVLWEFHKVHHAPKDLWFLTNYRGHPVNLLAYRLGEAAMSGVVVGTLSYVFNLPADIEFGAASAVLFYMARGSAGMLRHSRVWLHFGESRLGRLLNTIFVTPAHHQMHHGNGPDYWDKNFGGLFSIWDWAMGTLVRPGANHQFSIGLPAGDSGKSYDYTLKAALVDPFFGAWNALNQEKAKEKIIVQDEKDVFAKKH